MKIILTGSLGHIGAPLTESLVKQGHSVTVISSKQEKQAAIERLGASAVIGSLEDAGFLTSVLTGAEAVYCMVPPNYKEPDMQAYYKRIGDNYSLAIRQSGVGKAVHLSSMGADLEKDTGIILGSHYVETAFNNIPGLAVTHVRATYFYYNLNSLIDMIKHTGRITTNYGGDSKIVLVSPKDIAVAVAEEIMRPSTGMNIRYIASDELTGNEIARILGEAIGIPDLKWVTISDEQMHQGLVSNGVPQLLAENLVEMYSSLHNGNLLRDYYATGPHVLGTVKMTEYANEFAEVYKKN